MSIPDSKLKGAESDIANYDSLVSQMAKKRASKLIEIVEKEYDTNANWNQE
jgi:hypothetical protein